jgi:hypothetical protein
MSGRVVEVRIDQLVAPGVRAADARALVRAAERELGRLVASSGAAWPAPGAARVANVSAAVPDGASPAAAGVKLARTLHAELGR